MTDADWASLRARLGEDLFCQRMEVQLKHAARAWARGPAWFHPENLSVVRITLHVGLRLLGLYGRGRRNAWTFDLHEHTVVLDRLPESFLGFRLLHLSDLHLDMDPGLTDALLARLDGLAYDACIITGDFRAETSGDTKPSLRETARLAARLHAPVYAVMGNHDFIETAPELEAIGIRVLLNEHVVLTRGSGRIFLAGIDDPHFYCTDDMARALEGIPPGSTVLLASHSAECYREAEERNVDFMFNGHTHGGQICLPGGYLIFRNSRHPRAMDRGPWDTGQLRGYTSRGIGTTMVPVRFFSLPEIIVHVFARNTVLEPLPQKGLAFAQRPCRDPRPASGPV